MNRWDEMYPAGFLSFGGAVTGFSAFSGALTALSVEDGLRAGGLGLRGAGTAGVDSCLGAV